MSFSGGRYHPQTLALMTSAFGLASREADSMDVTGTAGDRALRRTLIARSIMEAAAKGERDPMRLKLQALRAIARRKTED